MELLDKMFMSPYLFTIAIRRRDRDATVERLSFNAEYVLPANRLHWIADPILIEADETTYLFYEAVHHNKGRIEVACVNDDCTIGEPVVILEEKHHLSYPHVFHYNDSWYMIPESAEINQVALYKAKSFPYQWVKEKILLWESGVDTTVFEQDGVMYLLTYIPHKDTECVSPKAFILRMGEEPLLQPIKWENYDELKCRGAGPLFLEQGKLIRPAQISQEHRYGDGIVFYNVTCRGRSYLECPYSELKPETVNIPCMWFDGLHTYTQTSRFEAIDIRCRKFDLFKIPRTIFYQLDRKMTHDEQ